MTSVKRLFWLPITLALAAITPLGLACGLVALTTPPAAATPAPGLAYEDSPFGFIQGEVVQGYRPLAEYLNDLGVSWDKICPGGTPIFIETNDPDNINFQTDVNFTNMDAYLETLVVDNGINITMPLMVFVKVNGEITRLDLDDYEEFGTVMIERYDGDGVDDAPGSPLIKYWFIGGSEMNAGVPQGVPVEDRKWPLTEVQTAEYVKIGYDLIQELHPEFRAILGGSISVGTWQQDGIDDYYYNLISELTGNNECSDLIFDYHAGSNPFQFKSQIDCMNIVDSTLNEFGYNGNEIWTTDVGGSWEEWQGFTEAEQAGDVVRRYAYTIANGQEKLFWTRIEEYDWTPDDSSIFDYMGLVHNPANNGGEDWKKLSYYTYKLVVEKLEGSDWDNIQTIQESDNVYAYKFTKVETGEPVYVAWWGYFDEAGYTPGDTRPITLTGLSGTAITVTNAVPAADIGLDVTDYNTAFTVTTHLVSDGAVTILLGEDPVMVEESDSATMDSYFGIFNTHDHDAYGYFKDQTGMTEQDFYNWADNHQAILKFHWTRTNTELVWEFIEPTIGGGYDWNNSMDTDDNFKAYYAQGQINLIAVIDPWRIDTGEDWRLYEDDFKRYVQDVVERYDGDGIDDADENVKVKMWQASNEYPGWQAKGGSRSDYVMLVTWMEEAVHLADPDGKIMLVATTTHQSAGTYPQDLKDIIDDLIAANVPFDAIDLHHHTSYKDGTDPGFPMPEVADARAFLDSRGLYDVEIFSCENGTWYGCPTDKPTQTEQEQARFLAQRVAYGPYVSLDHYLWNNLCEWYNFGSAGNAFNSMGLVSNGARNCEVPERLDTERVCYWTYKMLAEALDRPANSFVGQMSLTVDNDRYGYEYEETATALHKYVLWSWVGDQDVTFPINTTSAHVVNLITDRYGNILEEYDVYADVSGEITITIHDDPVLVIEFEDTIPYLDSPFGFHPGGVFKQEYQDSGYTDAINIGVGWTRQGVYAFWFLIQPDLEQVVYDFTLYDRQYGEIPTNTHILANIAPQGKIAEGRCLPGSWLPVDEVQYAAFVTATVERYDGDGIDDMPGLVNPIRHWQVGNEPNDRRPSDFAELQRITYQAIKQACPDCTVLIGGVPGMPGHYIANFDMAYVPILAELAGQYVDVFDFHWYGTATGEYRLRDAATGEDVLEYIRATLPAHGFPADLPLWITEMGAYSGDPTREPDIYPFQTERQQALDYFKRFIYPLSRGVEKVFPAFGLMEGFKYDDGYFDHTGLIYDGEDFGRGTDPVTGGDPGLGVKKLGYYTYKKMTETLEGADWATLTTLHDGTDSDHLYLFRVEKACTERSQSDGQPIHIAWWDYFDEAGYTPGDTKPITLTGLSGTAITVTHVVPAAGSGQDVTDYTTAFTVTTHLVSDGAVTILLGEDPVLVEEAESG